MGHGIRRHRPASSTLFRSSDTQQSFVLPPLQQDVQYRVVMMGSSTGVAGRGHCQDGCSVDREGLAMHLFHDGPLSIYEEAIPSAFPFARDSVRWDGDFRTLTLLPQNESGRYWITDRFERRFRTILSHNSSPSFSWAVSRESVTAAEMDDKQGQIVIFRNLFTSTCL